MKDAEGGVVELLASAHFEISVDKTKKLVRVKRTSNGFATTDECDRAHREAIRVLDMLSRRTLHVLVDLRDAVGRNDPAFEEMMKKHRKELFVRFARAAALVRTASGKMQVSRHMREDGLVVGVFLDEDAALAYLDGSGPMA